MTLKCSISTTFAIMFESDDEPDYKKSIKLKRIYDRATEEERKAIDNIFICLCGYSLETIINKSEEPNIEIY